LENGLELSGDSWLQWDANYKSTQAADEGAKVSLHEQLEACFPCHLASN